MKELGIALYVLGGAIALFGGGLWWLLGCMIMIAGQGCLDRSETEKSETRVRR